MMELEGKVAVITGAARGIGRAIALRLARDGADLVISDIREAQLSQVAQEVEALGRRALPVPADVRSSAQVQELFRRAVDVFGRVDILVNNAGVISIAPTLELTEEEWDWVMDVNAKGTFLCSQAAARIMVGQGQGKIVNISSIAGKTGDPLLAHYSASKFAVIGLTQVMARELAEHGNIQVNAVCPGFIDTEMLDNLEERQVKYLGRTREEIQQGYLDRSLLGRKGTPDEVASLVAFLASSDAGYITGQAYNICGGGEVH